MKLENEITIKKARELLAADQIEKLEIKEKQYRVFDSKGLYMEIHPRGSKYWRLKYYFEGKENRISLGVYPEISLDEARKKRNEIKRQVALGINPSLLKREVKERKIIQKEKEKIAKNIEKKYNNQDLVDSLSIVLGLKEDVKILKDKISNLDGHIHILQLSELKQEKQIKKLKATIRSFLLED